jgi:hypothetical protein
MLESMNGRKELKIEEIKKLCDLCFYVVKMKE